ncbi:MAG: hypothetical protein ABEJ68_06550 [Halobacteriaceae archaeon]
MSDPVALGTVDVSAAGGRPKMRLGDLTGDGRIDLLFAQGDDIDATRTPHEVTSLTAIDLDGEVRWQVGDVTAAGGSHGADYPVQIWDADGDGANEVCCVMDDRFVVVDGASGVIQRTHDLPHPDAHDCIVPANLTGGEGRQDVILKDRYDKLWALDADFELLWTHEGNTGHYPWPHDFDGDGREEVMAGYDFLDSDGTVEWSADITEAHADCIWIADVDADGDPEILIGEGGLYAYDPSGEELWRNTSPREVQHIAPGDFRSESGLQVAGLDRIVRGSGRGGGQDGIFVVDDAGELLVEEDRDPGGWLTILEPMPNWDGRDRDLILGWRRGGDTNPTLYDGHLNPVVTFPVDGDLAHADLCDTGREQVVIRDGDTVHLFGDEDVTLAPAPDADPRPQPKRLATATLYPGGER